MLNGVVIVKVFSLMMKSSVPPLDMSFLVWLLSERVFPLFCTVSKTGSSSRMIRGEALTFTTLARINLCS